MCAKAIMNPAEKASAEAFSKVCESIDERKSFILEAGAGAGKTYTLVQALRYLISKDGERLLRNNQRVACITYTNVAKDEIITRIDNHPSVQTDTIHSFCWSLMKDYQPALREELSNLEKWPERLEEAGSIEEKKVVYDLGYPGISDTELLLHHDDVLSLMVRLLERPKFQMLFISRYPVLFIDEYQDTNKDFMAALTQHILTPGRTQLIGCFGDSWQQIYEDGCGSIESEAMTRIGLQSNFRSVKEIVEPLNRIRIDLPQEVKDPEAEGHVAVFHTNSWAGERRKGVHWKGDLPTEAAHNCLKTVKSMLVDEGWDFDPEKTKILMLTHTVLAQEQGYSALMAIYSKRRDALIKKEDTLIEFFLDKLEPACFAYSQKQYGEMLSVLGLRSPALASKKDKVGWKKDMDALLKLRASGTVGEVLDHLKKTKRPRLPEKVALREKELAEQWQEPSEEEPSYISRLRKLREMAYEEISALDLFIDEMTPFSTKHGVKGAEFENVLVIFGRGWNHYNFGQYLEWSGNGVPVGKEDTFERNRNLFYVACSRPEKRLGMLFTQELSKEALRTLAAWYGDEAISALSF